MHAGSILWVLAHVTYYSEVPTHISQKRNVVVDILSKYSLEEASTSLKKLDYFSYILIIEKELDHEYMFRYIVIVYISSLKFEGIPENIYVVYLLKEQGILLSNKGYAKSLIIGHY